MLAKKYRLSKFLITAIALLALPAAAQTGLPIVNMVDDGAGGTKYSLTLQLLALMSVLTLLPSLQGYPYCSVGYAATQNSVQIPHTTHGVKNTVLPLACKPCQHIR